ncbi:MAG: DoxX family protein [Propionibacteriaceae bacterium]|nr:DoxX family protein [Propionibacteriaceae bacterium]
MSLNVDMRAWKNWVSLAARLVLGIVLIWAGASKMGNLESSVQAALAYQIVSYEVAQFIGYSLPFAEMALGLLLVIGLFTRVMGAMGAALMLVFIVAITSVWVRGISIDCGCFGNGGPVDHAKAMAQYPWEIVRDLALGACGVWLLIMKKPFLAVDSWLFRPVEDILAREDRQKRR